MIRYTTDEHQIGVVAVDMDHVKHFTYDGVIWVNDGTIKSDRKSYETFDEAKKSVVDKWRSITIEAAEHYRQAEQNLAKALDINEV